MLRATLLKAPFFQKHTASLLAVTGQEKSWCAHGWEMAFSWSCELPAGWSPSFFLSVRCYHQEWQTDVHTRVMVTACAPGASLQECWQGEEPNRLHPGSRCSQCQYRAATSSEERGSVVLLLLKWRSIRNFSVGCRAVPLPHSVCKTLWEPSSHQQIPPAPSPALEAGTAPVSVQQHLSSSLTHPVGNVSMVSGNTRPVHLNLHVAFDVFPIINYVLQGAITITEILETRRVTLPGVPKRLIKIKS